ncbi:MAG: hypothetical protein PHI66_02685 [Candidatus Pacebacteria bacterium]|nr:hypothetical protein [Candidatus Paceibacterota bacterium]
MKENFFESAKLNESLEGKRMEGMEEIRPLLDFMKNRIENVSRETGISVENVVEMSGLELNIIEQLKNPGEFIERKEIQIPDETGKSGYMLENTGSLIAYLIESDDNARKTYMNFFNENMDSVSPTKHPDRIIEFARDHHLVIKAIVVFLYFSSFPVAMAEDFFSQDMQINFDGQVFSLEDLAKNSDFKEALNLDQDMPVDVLQAYAVEPLSNDDGFALNFVISENNKGERVIGLNYIGTYDVQGDVKEVQEDYSRIGNMILDMTEGHNPSNIVTEAEITMEEFDRNRDRIISEISSTMGVPEERVKEYFEDLFYTADNPEERVSVVSLEDFDIDKDYHSVGEIQSKCNELTERYDWNNPDEKKVAIAEFESWGEKNGYDNIWSALSKERLDNPFSSLESHEGRGVRIEEIYGKVVVGELQEKGYDMDKLKNNHTEAINAIIDIVAERQGANGDFNENVLREDLEKWTDTDNGKKLNNLLSGKEVKYLPYSIESFENSPDGNLREELTRNVLDKYGIDIDNLKGIAKDSPKEAIMMVASMTEKEFGEEQGFSNSDRSSIFMCIKGALEEMGVDNFNKFIVTQTGTEDGRIVSQLVAPTKEGKLITSSIDFGSVENISVGQEESAVVEEAHNSVLTRVRSVNIMERVKNILSKTTK